MTGIPRDDETRQESGAGLTGLAPLSHTGKDKTMPIDKWAERLRASGRTPATITQRTQWLRRLERETGTPVLAHTCDTLGAWLAGHEWGRATRRGAVSALRGFYAWAEAEGLIEASPARLIAAPAEPPPCPRPVPEDVLGRALMRAGPREHAALMLGAFAGLRASEAARVHIRDMERDMYGPVLRISGKGGRLRLVPVRPDLEAVLRRAAAESPHGWILPNLNDMTRHVSGARVSRMCRPLLEGHSFHGLRHRFASRVYAGSGDILATQRLLGHASPSTTQRYVQTDAARLRDVAALAA